MTEDFRGSYDRKAGADKEASKDASEIRRAYHHDGAEKAVQLMQAEVDAVPAEQRSGYNSALLKVLQGDGRSNANILPDLSLAFANQHRGDVTENGYVSRNKIASAVRDERNPLYSELYRQFSDNYKQMRHENQDRNLEPWYGAPAKLMDNIPGASDVRHWLANKTNDWLGKDHGGGVSAEELNQRVGDTQAKFDKLKSSRKDLGLLATNPELFDAIAKSDGEIHPSDAEDFHHKITLGTDDESKRLRERFGKTPAALEQLEKTTDALLKSFNDPANADGKPGSVHKDGNDLWGAGALFGTGDHMTRESLARGLGYENADDAKKNLPRDVANFGTPNPDVQSLSSYGNTAQKKGYGPWQVAHRMLDGQQAHFKNPEDAQRMLTQALQSSEVWAKTKDQSGVSKINTQNRDAALSAIQATEAKKAADSGQPENNDLSSWFASRYPSNPEGETAAKGDVEAVSDFSNTKLRDSKDGPRAIAGRMLSGQEHHFSDPRKAAADLASAIGVKSGIHNSKKGAEQVTNENIDRVIEKIRASGNEELLDWFKKRYRSR